MLKNYVSSGLRTEVFQNQALVQTDSEMDAGVSSAAGIPHETALGEPWKRETLERWDFETAIDRLEVMNAERGDGVGVDDVFSRGETRRDCVRLRTAGTPNQSALGCRDRPARCAIAANKTAARKAANRCLQELRDDDLDVHLGNHLRDRGDHARCQFTESH